MIEKYKIAGGVLFIVTFLVSNLVPGLRNNHYLNTLILISLLIATVGFYKESKQKDKERKGPTQLFYNGKIYTFDKIGSIHEAVYVEKGKIEDLGDSQRLLSKYEKHATEKIDLKGKTVIPGFNDAHIHLYGLGMSLLQLDLTQAKSKAQLVQMGQKALLEKKVSNDQWLLGRGWNQEYFPDKQFPTRQDLDAISTDVPIALTRACSHIMVINTKAANLIGLSLQDSRKDQEIDRDKEGFLTGIIKENSMALVHQALPKPTVEEIAHIIDTGQQYLLSQGITSVHSDDLQHAGSWEDMVRAYGYLHRDNRLKLRVHQQCQFNRVEEFEGFLKKGGHGVDLEGRYKAGPLKILGDGTLGGRTAYLKAPYQDDPDNCGFSLLSQETLDQLVSLAHQHQMPVVIHSIGDQMMDMAFEAIDKSRKANKLKEKDWLRDGLVHCQITSEENIQQFSDMNVLAYIQPVFTMTDWISVANRIGEDRMKTSYNWKSLQDKGVVLCLSTDTPVETPNPFINLYAAVTRKDLKGKPNGGWMPEQRLSLEDSVRAYTFGGAFGSYEEKVKGTLEKGRLADMTVLSQDIFSQKPDHLRETQAVMTIIGGEVVYPMNHSPKTAKTSSR